MNVGRVLGRFSVVSLAVGYVGLATAADQPVVVAPAAPAVVGDVCPTCTAGSAGAPCGKAGCGNGCNPKKPVVGQLRPGACFGYFQTQWHRWEDVCPLPYQGVGQNDAPQRTPFAGPGGIPQAAPAAPPKSDAPPKATPMPTRPVPGAKTGILPGIPAPDGKFGK